MHVATEKIHAAALKAARGGDLLVIDAIAGRNRRRMYGEFFGTRERF